MLMYGASQAADIAKDIPNTVIYNLSSLNQKYTNYLRLVPPNKLGANTSYEFDVNYMHWIVDNDPIFMEFMKIPLSIYNGMNVFIVIAPDEWSYNLCESLMKLLQQRYGLNGILINDNEDIQYAEDSEFAEGYGIINLDRDRERYAMIYSGSINGY